MDENAQAGKKGGRIAKKARLELEQKTGKSVVTGENFLPPASQKIQLKDSKMRMEINDKLTGKKGNHTDERR